MIACVGTLGQIILEDFLTKMSGASCYRFDVMWYLMASVDSLGNGIMV